MTLAEINTYTTTDDLSYPVEHDAIDIGVVNAECRFEPYSAIPWIVAFDYRTVWVMATGSLALKPR